MTLDLNKIYNLLPAVYRIRDAELALQLNGALKPGEWTELQGLLAIQGSRTADQQRRLNELQDKRQRGPLKALMAVIAEQAEVLEASLPPPTDLERAVVKPPALERQRDRARRE